jgi:hypothetical protein
MVLIVVRHECQDWVGVDDMGIEQIAVELRHRLVVFWRGPQDNVSK